MKTTASEVEKVDDGSRKASGAAAAVAAGGENKASQPEVRA